MLSLGTDNWEYGSGAAHGQPWVATTLYDRKEGKEVGLKDLFKPGSDNIHTLSNAAIAQLDASGVSDSKWVSEGAAPKDENFQAFYPTEKGLNVIFEPYQVGPYAAGEPEATIPWSDLKPILNPNGPLSQVAK